MRVDAHVVEYSKVPKEFFSREVRRLTARVLNTPDRARQERVATSFSPLDVDACLYTYANTFEMSEFSCTAGRVTAF